MKQAIRLLYGQTIAHELLHVTFSSKGLSQKADDDEAMEVDESEVVEGEGSWRGEALFTSANYHAKKTVFLLFINRASLLLGVEQRIKPMQIDLSTLLV